MGFPSLIDNSKYSAFIYFLKPVLKVTYVVNSCLVPPLNPAVSPFSNPRAYQAAEGGERACNVHRRQNAECY